MPTMKEIKRCLLTKDGEYINDIFPQSERKITCNNLPNCIFDDMTATCNPSSDEPKNNEVEPQTVEMRHVVRNESGSSGSSGPGNMENDSSGSSGPGNMESGSPVPEMKKKVISGQVLEIGKGSLAQAVRKWWFLPGDERGSCTCRNKCCCCVVYHLCYLKANVHQRQRNYHWQMSEEFLCCKSKCKESTIV